MSEQNPASPLISPDPGATPEQVEAKKKKKKDKLRSAWISFVGRILAQMLGAVATVILGLMVVQSYQSAPIVPDRTEEAVDSPVPPDRAPRTGGMKALAVLPLENLSGDPRQDAFVDGLTESLIAHLSQVPDLRVTSRTSSMHFKGQRGLLPAIARKLGVDLVLEGSVVRAGERVRVTAQLIDAGTDVHLWARTYDPAERDVLRLYSAVAAAVVRDLRIIVRSAGRAD